MLYLFWVNSSFALYWLTLQLFPAEKLRIPISLAQGARRLPQAAVGSTTGLQLPSSLAAVHSITWGHLWERNTHEENQRKFCFLKDKHKLEGWEPLTLYCTILEFRIKESELLSTWFFHGCPLPDRSTFFPFQGCRAIGIYIFAER